MGAEAQGILGAVIGLVLGAMDYFILARLLERARLDERIGPEQARLVMIVCTVTGFVLFPILGYYIGRYVLV